MGARDGGDQLRPVFGNPALLRVGPDHEAADVLEKNERDISLGAELDEVCPLEGGFGEEDPVVGKDAHLVSVDAGEAWVGFSMGHGNGKVSMKEKRNHQLRGWCRILF